MKACLLLSLVCPIVSHAQSAPAGPLPPALVANGAFFALSVADIGASTRWYTEKLGLRVVMQVPKQDKAAVTVLEGGGLIVELIEHDDARPLGNAAPGAPGSLFVHGIFKVGVLVEDYEKLLTVLTARHVDIALGPFPARGGQRANVIVRDNAGNLIQFFGK
jgi:catechol 2,3-dioxygenase-like lactoylglutathione lyase family enzyme